MANTTTEILTVNGVVLNTYAKNIESLTGRLTTPGKRTSNITVPGRHGTVRVKNKKYDENVISLPMWVVGSDDDGKIPSGSTARKEFFKRVDELTELFAQEGPLDIRHTLPDGSIRQCFGDVMDTIDMTTSSYNPMAKFGVSIVVPDAFWQDLNPITQSLVASTGSVTATSFEGATAPMEDLTFKFTGPWTNPVLTFSDNSWLALDVAIAAGSSATVNCASWLLTGVSLPALRRLSPGGRWASLPPTSPAYIATGGTGRTSATKLDITGRRKYLVG